MSFASLVPGNVALVTGGASGIGLAACRRFAEAGLSVAVADRAGPHLQRAVEQLASALHPGAGAEGFATDVASRSAMQALEADVRDRFGRIDVLMANAGVQPGSDILGPADHWSQVLDVNLHGVINCVQAVLPGMLTQGTAGLVVITGSKQGITTPPGDPAYNVAKAGVKAFAEALQHDLRNRSLCGLTAHLLIPGFVFTPLTAGGRVEKPDAAWTPEQTIDFMLTRLDAGDFYILCPDNDVTRRIDERRILWAAGDIVENRPPLSRWHPDHGAAFDAFLKERMPGLSR